MASLKLSIDLRNRAIGVEEANHPLAARAMRLGAEAQDALAIALRETLAVAERNERGDYADRARSALALVEGC